MPLIASSRRLAVCASLGGAIFLGTALGVVSGLVQAGDMRILAALRSGSPDRLAGPTWLSDLAVGVDRLGSPAVIGAGALALVLVLAWRRLWREALLIVAAPTGALLLGQALKGVFDRERPAMAYRLVEAHGASFPSTQTLLATATLLAAALLTPRLARGAVAAGPVMVAVIAAGLIGLGRVYLGVHWASDVVAAWALGAAWACACRMATGPRSLGGRS